MELKKMTMNLGPYFVLDDIKKYTKYYIKPYYQKDPPSVYPEPFLDEALSSKLFPYFKKKVLKVHDIHHRYTLILSDSGMGKTAFLINLYKYLCKRLTLKVQ